MTMVRALARFGAMPIESLYLESSALGGLDRGSFDGAVAKLVVQEVASYRYNPAEGSTSLVLLPTGKKLARLLPREARSAMRFYL